MPEGNYSIPFDAYRSPLGMSLREYAAIQLRVADSGNPELDKMIDRANDRDAEQAARTKGGKR
jgi:hypothetical protein